jgi:hypothetical protein
MNGLLPRPTPSSCSDSWRAGPSGTCPGSWPGSVSPGASIPPGEPPAGADGGLSAAPVVAADAAPWDNATSREARSNGALRDTPVPDGRREEDTGACTSVGAPSPPGFPALSLGGSDSANISSSTPIGSPVAGRGGEGGSGDSDPRATVRLLNGSATSTRMSAPCARTATRSQGASCGRRAERSQRLALWIRVHPIGRAWHGGSRGSSRFAGSGRGRRRARPGLSPLF